ncbi:schwannomin-interacting protein 1 [Thalassophryne amazonica]|uniref:schwannomin-interacting protein 1 n=1 Tax=Thalassophryne amazonica TaxID=390379 RepID=UPI001470EEA7|nr:schwannomin-interacting protein 1 [Thalassophryne amazonica]XP_034020674.1 schwannomin-interacting protein 1 [Thalassophryne amazonica]
MDGEKEREREQREEKDSNEAEEEKTSDCDADNEEEEEEDSESAALVWQESYDKDSLHLPIMHWEALSLRIAELEKQEEEKKEKMAKSPSDSPLNRCRAPLSWTEERGRRAESWDDGDNVYNSHVMALTSRLQTQMNLQLCFINNSESEEEDEKQVEVGQKENSSTKKGTVHVHQHPPPPAKPEKPKASKGFRNTLRILRDKLRTDHKPHTPAHDPVAQQRRLSLSDLQSFSVKDLNSLCASLSQAIQDLSSELVGRLQIRDQLRTEQDALLLEVQDLTSL